MGYKELIQNIEYIIDTEQNTTKKSYIRNLLNSYLYEQNLNNIIYKEKEELEESLNKKTENKILKAKYDYLKLEYEKLQNKIDEIYRIINEKE